MVGVGHAVDHETLDYARRLAPKAALVDRLPLIRLPERWGMVDCSAALRSASLAIISGAVSVVVLPL